MLDLGDAVVLLPPDGPQRLLAKALSAEDHRRFVADLEDPDLAAHLRRRSRRRRASSSCSRTSWTTSKSSLQELRQRDGETARRGEEAHQPDKHRP